jgi:hypothetical protein
MKAIFVADLLVYTLIKIDRQIKWNSQTLREPRHCYGTKGSSLYQRHRNHGSPRPHVMSMKCTMEIFVPAATRRVLATPAADVVSATLNSRPTATAPTTYSIEKAG